MRQRELDHANVDAQGDRAGALIGAITAEFDQSLTIESGNLAFSELSLQKSKHIRLGSEGCLADGSHIFDVKIDQFAEGLDLSDP